MKNVRYVKKVGILSMALGTAIITPVAFAATGSSSNNNTYSTSSSQSTSANTGSSSWESDNSYWRSNYSSRPYYKKGYGYEVYQPAYRYGNDVYLNNPDRDFDEISEQELREGWKSLKNKSKLTWEEAKEAVRDSYERAKNSVNNATE